jgi:hypothetical protein
VVFFGKSRPSRIPGRSTSRPFLTPRANSPTGVQGIESSWRNAAGFTTFKPSSAHQISSSQQKLLSPLASYFQTGRKKCQNYLTFRSAAPTMKCKTFLTWQHRFLGGFWMSFQEKSLALQMVSLVAVFGSYFVWVWPRRTERLESIQIAAFVTVLMALVLLQIVGHSLLAIASRKELSRTIQTDERDAMIRLRALRISSWILASGVFLSLCIAALTPGNFAFTHILLAFWVIAQLIELLSQWFDYRRGF